MSSNNLYEITSNWDGDEFLGLTIKWDYALKTCNISMPGYIQKALQRLAIPPTARPQHAPHTWSKPVYGQHQQLSKEPANTSPTLDAAERLHLKEIIGTLLYYGQHAINSTLLVALRTLASAQTDGTKATANACKQLLKYCATHPDAIICFQASDMCLHINSDASYLSEPKAVTILV
jgi:hypothetical protein